jgi:hypothetical protein
VGWLPHPIIHRVRPLRKLCSWQGVRPSAPLSKFMMASRPLLRWSVVHTPLHEEGRDRLGFGLGWVWQGCATGCSTLQERDAVTMMHSKGLVLFTLQELSGGLVHQRRLRAAGHAGCYRSCYGCYS